MHCSLFLKIARPLAQPPGQLILHFLGCHLLGEASLMFGPFPPGRVATLPAGHTPIRAVPYPGLGRRQNSLSGNPESQQDKP